MNLKLKGKGYLIKGKFENEKLYFQIDNDIKDFSEKNNLFEF